jgi:hypothetical protein
MNLDVPTSYPLSTSEHDSTSAGGSLSAASRATLDLSPSELATVGNGITAQAKAGFWRHRLENGDSNSLQSLHSDVLMQLVLCLSSTAWKDSVPARLDLVGASAILANFTAVKSEDWSAGLQEGLNDNNWERLIAHRASQSVS